MFNVVVNYLNKFQETEEVCGSDNQTYSSVCALRDVACREKKRLHVKHMGSCGEFKKCANEQRILYD